MTKRIMIASGKGGVGKSILCLGVAAGLCAAGKRVLVVEADTGFRGLDISLDLQDRALYDLSDLLEQRSTLDQTLLRHTKHKIELICAPNDPEYLPRTDRLTALFGELSLRGYDFVLCDCGAGFGPWQAGMSQNCNMALLVTTPEQAAVRAAAATSLLLHKKGLHEQRLIINRIPRVLPQNKAIRDLDDVIDLVGVPLLGAVPEGLTPGIAQRDGHSKAAEEVYRIAQRLCGVDRELTLLAEGRGHYFTQ
ncbi:MAG: P-loop NTPase [Angelakisella sp.]